MKQSLEESSNLYIATVLVQIASTITGIIEMVLSEFRSEIQIIMLLHMVDVIVLALSQGDTRKALKYTPNKNRVSPL